MNQEHLDVLIIGAGLSGIGAAYHLQTQCPDKSFTILEARDNLGGTWDLFRYPGIRSDSDMHTLGYSFRPWTDRKAIAGGGAILEYIRDTAETYGIDRRIRYGTRVRRASWSSEQARWTVECEHSSGETSVLTCGFILGCTGYYRYDHGYTPEFEGRSDFTGTVVHPQHWPEDIDLAGKRVVIIGSGATAVTLLPELAQRAKHVTMLQRSPTYLFAGPEEDHVALWLQDKLPQAGASSITRWKNILIGMGFYQFSRRFPKQARKLLLAGPRHLLGPDFDVEKHFTPDYNPWDQRLCYVPNGDLYKAIRGGRASVATDHIDRFTKDGIRLQSGEQLQADVIVTATGLEMLFLGGIELEVDGEAFDVSQALTYKGTMLSGLPNLAVALGYSNAAWTLRLDIICGYVCQLLKHMDSKGYSQCRPERTEGVEERPALDLQSGYIQRAIGRFPKQGTRAPWLNPQNYLVDRYMMGSTPIEDSGLKFSGQAAARHGDTRPALRDNA